MSLETLVMASMKEAMKAKDKQKLTALRAIKSAILIFKTDGSGNELNEEGEIKILQKLVKQRRDSLAIYEEQKREDLAQVERVEIDVIEAFLPQQLSADEIGLIIADVISKSGATSMKDMGKVMGMASKELAGRADNKMVAAIVKEKLA